MDIESRTAEINNSTRIFDTFLGFFNTFFSSIKAFSVSLKNNVVKFITKIKNLGKDDPRRVTHSIKVGLTLSLVSLLYYLRPIYGGLGASTMWAILTVVVVFEFTVGATLGKGFNRALATFLAGALGVGAHYLTTLAGDIAEPILLWLFVFLIATTASFSRFFPRIKARYDYGVLIFILTFSLVSISGYRVDKILELAHQRLATILIGCLSCVIISISVFPVWAGEDLNKLISLNIEKLGDFLHGFGGEYFGNEGNNGDKNVGSGQNNKAFLQGYKSVLNSKIVEESLANFARWEPPHGRFRYRHPWKQYLKIGALTRQCAYLIDALSNCISSEVQAPLEIKKIIQDSCIEMTMECSKALMELSRAIKTMTQPNGIVVQEQLKNAADNLRTLMKTATLMENVNILDVVPAATVTSLLVEIVGCIEIIAESVNELAHLAKFKVADATVTTDGLKPQQLLHRGSVRPLPTESNTMEGAHVVIVVCG